MKNVRFWLLSLIAMLSSGTLSYGQDTFFKGKTIRIVVPFSAGGGYDIYSRIIGRHMGKHISGNPSFIVENMTGAGGLIGINHVYKVAKPDGLTLATPIGTMFVDQIIGRQGIEFDGRKFEYIGAPAQDTQLLAVHKRTGIKTMEQWLAHPKPVKFGSTGPTSANENIAKIAKAALNLPMQVILGVILATWPQELQMATLSFWRKPRAKPREPDPYPAGHRLRQNRDGPQAHPWRHQQLWRDGSSICRHSRHAQRPRGDLTQGLYGYDERSGVCRRARKS
jgi:hypothetical protein